jgi:hypothetical protein
LPDSALIADFGLEQRWNRIGNGLTAGFPRIGSFRVLKKLLLLGSLKSGTALETDQTDQTDQAEWKQLAI